LVRPDPRSHASSEALAEQHQLGLQIRARLSELHRGVLQLRAAREQLGLLVKRAGKEQRFAALVARAEAAAAALTEVERKLVAVDVKSSEGTLRFPVQLNEQFDSVRQLAESADAAPVPALREVFAGYDTRLQAQLSRLRELRAGELPAIEAEARKQELPALVLPQ
jgi:hypothetical protein